MSIPITNQERETNCNFDYVTKKWKIWSNVPKHINKMKKLGFTVLREDDYGTTFMAPENGIRIASIQKKTRQMTQEQKEAASQRLKAARMGRVNADQGADEETIDR